MKNLIAGFVPFFGLKIQGLFKDFSRTYFSFFKDSTNCKIKGCSPYSSNCAELKSSLKSMPFLVHPQHSQFCTQGLCLWIWAIDRRAEWRYDRFLFVSYYYVLLRLCQWHIFSNKALQNLSWIKLATNFKDFPALTTIFKDFQGLEFLF